MSELMDEIVRLQNCRRNTYERADKHPAALSDIPFEDEENTADAADEAYIQGKLDRILEKLSEIDELISTTAKGWTIDRMGKVELTIIRLAVYEIKFDEKIPDSVAINEAVELAKKFGQEESSGFVNGVLARFV